MLENTKLKYQLINGLIINSIFVLVFFLLIYLLLPSLDEISEKKASANLLVDDYNKTLKSGLSFTDFMKKKDSIKDIDAYKKSIFTSLDKDFYDKNFINNSEITYEKFLFNLDDSVKQKINSREFINKQSMISSILPIYSNSANFSGTITDAMFINNVENLIERFNLSTTDPISVSNIMPAEEKSTKKTAKSSLDSEIYYFAIPLKLTGTKKDIIDFITYIEDAGTVVLNGGDIEAHYSQELADIESIKISSYLDSDTSTIVSGQDMISFVKNTQAQEKLDIDITLNFYVKGLASYKVQDYVKNLNAIYSKLSKDTQSLISKVDQNDPNLILVFNKLNSIKKYLDTIKKDLSDLIVKSNKGDNLSETYNQAYKFNTTISNLSGVLDGQKKIIDNLKNNKK